MTGCLIFPTCLYSCVDSPARLGSGRYISSIIKHCLVYIPNKKPSRSLFSGFPCHKITPTYVENYLALWGFKSWREHSYTNAGHNIKESSSPWSHFKNCRLVSLWCKGVWVKHPPRQGDTPQLNSIGLSATSCHRRAMSQVYRAAVSIIATGLRDGAQTPSPGADSEASLADQL